MSPPPKDKKDFEIYREKQRKIALEKGYGKWMLGKTSPMKGKHHIEKTKKLLSEKFKIIAKEKGFGKWMTGKKASQETKEKLSKKRKCKKYEEIYGNRSNEEKLKRKNGNNLFQSKRIKKMIYVHATMVKLNMVYGEQMFLNVIILLVKNVIYIIKKN